MTDTIQIPRADLDAAIEALRGLLEYVTSTRQGYLLVPFARELCEARANQVLAKYDGYSEWAASFDGQIELLKAAQAREIETMNANLKGHRDAS